MKSSASRLILLFLSFTVLLIYNASCEYKAQEVAPVIEKDQSSTTELVAIKTTTPPTIDGTIDAAWVNAPLLKMTPAVPDPGNGLFSGYINDKLPATLRAMYDGNTIYFLAEYADNTKSVQVTPWYFNPATKLWAQEGTSKSFDQNGVMTRTGFGEDKIAMLWNIDASTPKFVSQTCYASCHVFAPYLDYSVTPAVQRSNAASGNHYTSGINEKIDMWWGHLGRDVIFGQMDDNYQDWAGGSAVTNLTGGNANGRHVDDIAVSGTSTTWPNRPNYSASKTQGTINNRQALKLDGTGASVNVPMWVVPNATDTYYVLASDTLSNKAVKITKVSSAGILSYNGGTIDPTVGTDYQRIGDAVTGGIGPKAIPSYIASPLIDGRADITCKAIYTGSGWVVEYKRALKTKDVLKQDIDFSNLNDQQFGFAVWDQSNNQHAIHADLVLKFKK
jgi:Ethylbenzene dehydrogenase